MGASTTTAIGPGRLARPARAPQADTQVFAAEVSNGGYRWLLRVDLLGTDGRGDAENDRQHNEQK
ncbi:MAG: hypothetical protein ABR540_14420 [Acidimicrobiales bacterium]